MRRWLSYGCIGLGMVLFLVAIEGHYFPVSESKLNPLRLKNQTSEESFDLDWQKHIRSLDDLYEDVLCKHSGFDQLVAQEKMKILFDALIAQFRHQEAKHTLRTNYLLYGLGQLDQRFLHVWDPDILLFHFNYAFCDQSSYVLLALARKAGFHVRHVGLEGHVVLEVWYDQAWHLYDPDAETIPLDRDGTVMSLQELTQDLDSLTKYYPRHKTLFLEIQNHNMNSYPQGSRHQWRGNVLAILESLMELFKFIVPVVIVGFGVKQWRLR